MLPNQKEQSWLSTHKGKQRRQRSILQAARALISRSGAADLKMREVAIAAGVSIATPYNLFGSKNGIIQAIYDEETEKFNQFLDERGSSDPLSRIFDVVDLVFEYYARAPDFYKKIVNLLYRDPRSDFVVRASKPQIAYVQDLLAAAVVAGDLRAETPVRLIGSVFTRAFISVCQEWLDGFMPLAEARNELGATVPLLLGSFVTARAREKFATRTARYSQGP